MVLYLTDLNIGLFVSQRLGFLIQGHTYNNPRWLFLKTAPLPSDAPKPRRYKPRLWKKGQWISQRLEGVIRRGFWRSKHGESRFQRQTTNLQLPMADTCYQLLGDSIFSRENK